VCSTEVKSLKDEIDEVSDEIEAFRNRMDDRFQSMMERAELDYQQNMTAITLSYQLLSRLALELNRPRPAVIQLKNDIPQPQAPVVYSSPPSPPPAATWKHMDILGKPFSPTCVADLETTISLPAPPAISPLMALSMIASIDHQQEFGR
jgi:hypothetical protein